MKFVEIAEKRRRAHERLEVLGVADVARVHDDEVPRQAVVPRPRVVERLRRDRLGVDPVRDHANPIGRRAFLLEPLPHRVADRDHAVGAAQVEPDHLAQRRHEQAVVEAAELRGDLREHVLGDDEQRRAEALGDREPDVAHHRRIGHRQHEIGPRARQPVQQRAPDVRGVVERAEAEARPLEGGRRHAHDLDAVADSRCGSASCPCSAPVRTRISYSSVSASQSSVSRCAVASTPGQ